MVQIEDEIMCYTSKTDTTLSGISRGKRCAENAKIVTAVTEHAAGRRVYAEASGLFNTIIGFDIASNFSDGGLVGTVKGVVKTVFAAPEFIAVLARMVLWDFDFLTGPYVYVKYLVLGALSAGLVLGGFKLALGR